MRKHLWLAAGLTFALASPVIAQLPGIDAPTGAGVGSSAPRDSNDRTGRKPAAPATPSDMAPRDSTAVGRDQANTDNSAGSAAQGRVPGSAQGKIEGGDPVDSGIGRSGTGTGGGVTKGGGGDAMK
ncbi:MAG TPA: hypothetical protein VGP15_12010 [Burkholderiales bacterium]|jgi:hypothetical protein|nr:hypothetical protein [Burkholderiales bacterium]